MRTILSILTTCLTLVGLAAPSDDLLAYWTLDNNTTDSAPGGSVNDNGTWVGSTSYSSVQAQFGSAASLNGSNYISIPTSSDIEHAGGSLTISVWCRVAIWDTNWQTILSKGENSNYRIARNNGNSSQIAFAGGAGDIRGGSVNDQAWHHLTAISEDGEITKLFVDGTIVATGGAPSLTDSGFDLLLGTNPQNLNRTWNGEIDDVAIFNAPLSDQQATAVHNFGTNYGYPLSEVIQILDAHDSGTSTTIGTETWTYQPSNTGSGTFIVLGTDGSGVDLTTGPAITSFGSSPIFITSGGSATLSWQITPPFTAVSIDQGVGNVLAQTNGVTGAGSISVSPTTSTTYTITATNADGSSLQSTTLFVDVDPSTPRINEFSADTASDGLLDEDGDNEDWIEIYNPGPNAADLSTFYLTDDNLILNKWAFPSVIMPADSYLVVFASSKNRAVAGSELHTNFRLSAGGEYLALTRDNGSGGFTTAGEFSPEYPAQEEGFSYGLAADNITSGFFNPPTPNAANGAAFEGFVADTIFSVDRGFFSASFSLMITSATPGAEIRYTTDGSEPTSTTGTIYTGPITISSTTTLRAAAFRAGFQGTNVDTHTYFFLDDIRDQFADGAAPAGWPSANVNNQQFNYGMDPDITSRYTAQEMVDALSAIPSVSITTQQDNLTDNSLGIYVNPGNRGRSWERAASIEFVHPGEDNLNIQENCGLRVRGGFSRSTSNPKHAFRLFFRSQYGASKLDYPLFGAEGAEEFDKVDLRTSQNYSWAFQNDPANTFLREILGRDLQASFDHPHTRSRYYHLYLNGVYWGLYMTQERAEARLGETYLGGDADNFDTLKSSGASGSYLSEATDGTIADEASDWSDLWNLTRNQEANPNISRFMEMQGFNPDGSVNLNLPVYLDVDNLIEYQMIIGYTGNYDAPLSAFVGAANNWYAIRDRVRDNLGFQFFVHDGEHSMGAGGRWAANNNRINTTNGAGSRADYSRSNPSFFHLDLAESTPEYRLRFADRAHLALFNNGLLSRDSIMDHMNARRSTVADVIIAESARWGDSKRTDPFDEQDWVNAVNSLTTTINTRSDVFLGHLRGADLYPDLDAPIYSQHGGVIASGSTINAIVPQSGTHLYYMIGAGDADETDWADDLDPRLLGGAVKSSASVIAIAGGGGGVSQTTYINEGDDWKYLDDGSNQGTAWRASGFNDSSWAEDASELGYGDNDEATTLDDPGSGNRPATYYFRKTITIPDPTIFGDFELTITYDDSYAIYVNGSQVARHSGITANAPFNEYSTNNVTNNAVDTLTIPKSAFSAGSNTIAVEIHQTSNTSSDVSFNLELIGMPLGAGNTTTLSLPDTITEPVWIKSRTFNSTTGEWSALNQAFFTTASPADSSSIVISEVSYHPTDPTAAELAVDPTFDQDDFEFIEIMNTGTDTLDLGEAALVLIPIGDHLEGVEFTFPLGTLIAPGERLVIAANSAAFAARYPSVPIAGDYSGRLDNSGEWITLVDADGNVIDSFRYNDLAPWPVAADGSGATIVRVDPSSDLDPADPANWTASTTNGGTPGQDDQNTFSGDPLADLDGDGYIAIIEYAQGLSDTIFSDGQHINVSTVDVDGVIYPAVSYREDPSATDATISVQISPDLLQNNWSEGAPDLIFVETLNDPDGIPRHTYRLNDTFDSLPRQFFRLKVDF